MTERPAWWPRWTYEYEDPMERLVAEVCWQDGVEAMAKALIERIEALNCVHPAVGCVMFSEEQWVQFKREVLG